MVRREMLYFSVVASHPPVIFFPAKRQFEKIIKTLDQLFRNKVLFENVTRSSNCVVCLLGSGNTTLFTTLCSAVDELSNEGDEDSTNRKKRIYLAGQLNDDP